MSSRIPGGAAVIGLFSLLLLYLIVGPWLAHWPLPVLQVALSPESCEIQVDRGSCCEDAVAINGKMGPFYRALSAPAVLHQAFSTARRGMCDCASYMYGATYSGGMCALRQVRPPSVGTLECDADADMLTVALSNSPRRLSLSNISRISVYNRSTGNIVASADNVAQAAVNITRTFRSVRADVVLSSEPGDPGMQENGVYGVNFSISGFVETKQQPPWSCLAY